MSSVTVLSPRERAARTALARPSSSTSWQLMSVTNFLCIGRDRSEVEPLVPEPVGHTAVLFLRLLRYMHKPEMVNDKNYKYQTSTTSIAVFC